MTGRSSSSVLLDPETQTTAITDTLARLQTDLDQLTDIGLGTLSKADLEDLIVAALTAAERSKAIAGQALSEAESSGKTEKRRGRRTSATTRICALTGWAAPTVNSAKFVGGWVSEFPVLRDAWLAGTLTQIHVEELRRAYEPSFHAEFVLAQSFFVEQAALLDFPAWMQALGYWLLHVNPDGTLPNDQPERYGLRIRTLPNGDVEIEGVLDPITGEAIQTAIDYQIKRTLDAEKTESDDGDPLPVGRRQRNAHALATLVTRGHKRADGTMPIPLVNIVMSQKVAEDTLARVLDAIDPETGQIADFDPLKLPVDAQDIDGRCETIRGTPLDPRSIWPILLIGRLRRQIMTAESRTIDLGTDTRLFPPALKQALLVESRGRCVIPGCPATLTWLVADHIHPASKHGPTSLENGQILCTCDNGCKGNCTNWDPFD